MRKSTILGVALGLAALTGLGSAGAASAQGSHRGGNREWREDWNRGHGNGARAFTGTWRLDERRNRHDRDGRWGSDFASRITQLPSVIRIERERRELRVENSRGRLLREIDLRGGDARDGRLQLVRNGFGNTRIVETFTLREGGRELVVHTAVQGRGGTKRFTSIYDRA
jgi:hypothetical protein